MPKTMPKGILKKPKRNLKIPPQLLPPVQQEDLASKMRGLNINRPNLTIRKPSEVNKDINKQLDAINKKVKGKRANVDDIMKELRKMNVKVTEQKNDKKGGRKTRRKRRRRKKKTRRR